MADIKPWYKSKGAWGGLLVIFGGLSAAVGKFLQGTLDFVSLSNTILPLIGAGLGIIGIRFAKK